MENKIISELPVDALGSIQQILQKLENLLMQDSSATAVENFGKDKFFLLLLSEKLKKHTDKKVSALGETIQKLQVFVESLHGQKLNQKTYLSIHEYYDQINSIQNMEKSLAKIEFVIPLQMDDISILDKHW